MDIVFYDVVGGAYTGETLRTKGLGGTEQNIVFLAEELARRGKSVLVANGVKELSKHEGVLYAPASAKIQNVDTLISVGSTRSKKPIHIDFKHKRSFSGIAKIKSQSDAKCVADDWGIAELPRISRYRSLTVKQEPNLSAAPNGICLCMIVKDEAHVIRRCLDSVRHFVDAWCVVDTGSTDGTQNIVRDVLKNIPGTLHERPWVNFKHNRNESIELAVGVRSHVFVIDADDVLEATKKPTVLPLHCYQMHVVHGEMEHHRPHVFRPEPEYAHRYHGVVHEWLGGEIFSNTIDGAMIRIVGGGARSQDPKKFERDAILLEAAFQTDPDPRNVFYLAQSWRDAGDLEKASHWYEKRADMGGGYIDEIFIALWELAKLLERRECSPETVIWAYIRAWENQPHRAEPLWSLAMYLRVKERYALAASFADTARRIPKPSMGLFIDTDVYEWKCLREMCIAGDWVPGRRAAAIEAGERLLKSNAPEDEKAQTRRNIGYSKDKLKNEGR